MADTLSQLSVFAIYSTMGIYTLAFVAFALDLAWRSGSGEARTILSSAAIHSSTVVRAAETLKGADAGAGPTTTLTRAGHTENSASRDRMSKSLRVGFALTILGFILHLVGVVLRGVAADRVPWSNMWEFSITGTLIIVGVFLLVNLRHDLRFLGAFVLGLSLIFLGIAASQYYVDVIPLQPALQSYWLVIHVIVAIIATGFFALAFALSAVQLLQGWRERRTGREAGRTLRFLSTLPSSVTLESLVYRLSIVGFILWTFTLMAGSIWAERAWGRYWGWDTKEVWTFIIWVLYAGYIHARATRGWSGSRSTWLGIIGFAAVMFNFGIVNVFFNGLHSYSGL